MSVLMEKNYEFASWKDISELLLFRGQRLLATEIVSYSNSIEID